MAKFRVKTDFYTNRMHYEGEAYNPETLREEKHLLQTGQIEKVIEKKKKPVSKEKIKGESLGDLRLKYEELKGDKPHHLWKEARLKEEINKL